MWKYYALLSALFAALTAIFSKAGVRGVDSNLATAIRTLFILLLAWGVVFAGGKAGALRAIDGRTWLFLLLSGVATGLSWLFYFKALQVGDVSRVVAVDKLSVVFTLLLALLFMGEQPGLKAVAGALLVTAGTILMSMK